MRFASLLWVLPMLADPALAVKGSLRRKLQPAKETSAPTASTAPPTEAPAPTRSPSASPTSWDPSDDILGPDDSPLFAQALYNAIQSIDTSGMPDQYYQRFQNKSAVVLASLSDVISSYETGSGEQLQSDSSQQLQVDGSQVESGQQLTVETGSSQQQAPGAGGAQQQQDESTLDEYKKGKDDSSSSDGGMGDALCDRYCDKYLKICASDSDFYSFFDYTFFYNAKGNNLPNAGSGLTPPIFRRNLVRAFEPDLFRYSTAGIETTRGACMAACAKYPRPLDPAEYTSPVSEGVNTLTDTFWCRMKHLDLADGFVNDDPIAAALHCPAAGPSGSYVCVNYQLTFTDPAYDKYGYYAPVTTRATIWERRRAGTETARHLAYCDTFYEDTIADCTKAGLDDVSLPLALSLLPLKVEHVILNNNPGVTKLGANIFSNNIVRASQIKTIIMDDGNIASLDNNTFTGLPKLQIISLNMQKITSLPGNLLTNCPNLKEFSMKNTRDRPGLLTSIPATLFSVPIGLQRVVISGQRFLTSLPGVTTGGSAFLPNVKSVDLSSNGFVSNGLSDALFSGAFLVESIDLSGNELSRIPSNWFNTQKDPSLVFDRAFPLRVLKFYNNPISSVGLATFDFLLRLNYLYLHDTNLKTIDPFLLVTNISLISYTLRPRP